MSIRAVKSTALKAKQLVSDVRGAMRLRNRLKKPKLRFANLNAKQLISDTRGALRLRRRINKTRQVFDKLKDKTKNRIKSIKSLFKNQQKTKNIRFSTGGISKRRSSKPARSISTQVKRLRASLIRRS